MGETCVVELRHAITGAYFGAFTTDDGALVARSRAFSREDAAAATAVRDEIRFALESLG